MYHFSFESECSGNIDFDNYYVLLKQLNLDRLLARMWDEMGLVRVYTKPQGQQADFDDPAVLSAVCYMH